MLFRSAVLTGIGVSAAEPAIASEAGNGTTKLLDGPVYMGISSPPTFVSDLKSAVALVEGDFWFYDAACGATTSPLAPPNLGFAPNPPRRSKCTVQPWQKIAPMPALPPKPLPIDPSGRDDLVPGCRIFFPGAYSSPPAVSNGDNYFVSGEF